MYCYSKSVLCLQRRLRTLACVVIPKIPLKPKNTVYYCFPNSLSFSTLYKMQKNNLSPFVYWGQKSDEVTLTIDLKDVATHNTELKDKSLSFFAVGVGAKGLNDYSFSIELYSDVISEKSYYKITDRNIEFVLKKKSLILWPRLSQSAVKPQWLKVDFDRIKQEDLETTSESEAEEVVYRSPISRIQKNRNFGRGKKDKVQEMKTAYLFLYNLFQFVGFIYLFVIFIIHLLKEGPGTITIIYPSLRNIIKFLNLMQVLEIINPLIGYTSGSALLPAIQLSGRSFFIFLLIDYQIEIQSHYATFYLLLIYTLSELIRYPYYMLHIYKVNIRLVTWVRYSAWIILYPLGFVFEALIIYNSIPLLEKSEKLSILLPNSMNFAFFMPTLLRFYLNFGIIFLFYFMISHMVQQRSKILNGYKKKIH